MHNRLDQVQEIEQRMDVNGPRLAALAAQKLQRENPELVEDWQDMQEAHRRHQAMLRKKEYERRRKQEQELGRGRGLGISLGIER